MALDKPASQLGEVIKGGWLAISTALTARFLARVGSVVDNIAKESADPPPQTMLPAVREGTYRPNAAAAVPALPTMDL